MAKTNRAAEPAAKIDLSSAADRKAVGGRELVRCTRAGDFHMRLPGGEGFRKVSQGEELQLSAEAIAANPGCFEAVAAAGKAEAAKE